MDKYILVYRQHDPEDARPLAIIHPDCSVTGTDEPTVLGDIRQALQDHIPGVWTFTGDYMPLSPKGHNPRTVGWAIAVQAALAKHGYRARPVGYQDHAGSHQRRWAPFPWPWWMPGR